MPSAAMVKLLIPVWGCFFSIAIDAAATFNGTAIVSLEKVAALQEKLATPWRVVAYENASSEDIASAQVLAPGMSLLGDPATFAKVLARMQQGRLLQWMFTGTDKLNISAVPSHFAICDVHQAGQAIPEYVAAAILSWNVGFPGLDRDFRQCTWKGPGEPNDCRPSGMHRMTMGQTVGIVGYGTIGQGVAQRMAALGMRAIAVTYPVPKETPKPLAWIAGDEALPRLMAEADFVVVAVPLLPSTQGLVSAAAITQMKPTGVLINIARGPIVDEQGLHEALKAKRIGGAVLDVWWRDWSWSHQGGGWPADFNFSALPNVWMTPHVSGETSEAMEEEISQAAANLDALAMGKPLKNVVRSPGFTLFGI